jgi:nucleoside-diphosphate-sugar epimerase
MQHRYNWMTRVLVLGGSGRVGTMLRRVWAHDSADVTFTYQTRNPDATDDMLWDVLHAPVPAQTPFACMIALSGVVPAPGADLALNTALGVAAVEAAAHLDIPAVLLASSSAVYGSAGNAPFTEDTPLAPVNDYGRAKQEMETACQTRATAAGVHLCCLRIGNVAGADALLRNGAALEVGAKLRLDRFADGGTPLRSYIGPQTLAQVLMSLVTARRGMPPVLNIAAPRPVTMQTLAQAAQLPFDLVPAGSGAHKNITLDCSALTGLHRFSPADSTAREMVRQWQTVR